MKEKKIKNFKVNKTLRAGLNFSFSFEKIVSEKIIQEAKETQVPMSRIVNNIIKKHYKI